jgi:putative DNA primase/helicase
MTAFKLNGHSNNGKPVVRAKPRRNLDGDFYDYSDSMQSQRDRETEPKRKKKVKKKKLKLKAEPVQEPVLPFTPQVTCFGQMTPQVTKWLWEGRIALGKLCLLAGHAGLGKSTVTLDFAARVSAGLPWPLTDKTACAVRAPKGDVLIMSAEDTPEDVILPRLLAAGADVNRCHLLEGYKLKADDRPGNVGLKCVSLDGTGQAVIRQAIKDHPQCKLLIIDPVSAFGGRVDSHKNAEVREQLAALSRIAHEANVAVIMVTHFSKTTAHKQRAQDRVMGSAAYVAVSRTAWAVIEDGETGDPERRLFLSLKNNLAKHSDGMAFSIVSEGKTSKVDWEDGAVQMTADEAMALKPKTAGDKAADWLREYLSDRKPHDRDKLMDAALEAKFSQRTIERVSKDVGVKKELKGYPARSRWTLRDPNDIADVNSFVNE